jgi:hypothetical protein
MQIVAQVIAEGPSEFTSKTRGVVKTQRVSLLDKDPNVVARLRNTFDYDMTEDEKAKYAGKVLDKTLVVGINDVQVYVGRMRVQGRILEVK